MFGMPFEDYIKFQDYIKKQKEDVEKKANSKWTFLGIYLFLMITFPIIVGFTVFSYKMAIRLAAILG